MRLRKLKRLLQFHFKKKSASDVSDNDHTKAPSKVLALLLHHRIGFLLNLNLPQRHFGILQLEICQTQLQIF
jgi:hypothetical protein